MVKDVVNEVIVVENIVAKDVVTNLFPPLGSTYPSTITDRQALGTLKISPT